MLKKLVSDGAVYGVSGAIAKGVQVFLIPIYTHVFSPAEYGVIDLLIVFAALINLTVALEISLAVARYYGTSNSDEEKRQYASSALWFSVAAYLLFFIMAFTLSGWLNFWWFGSMQWTGVFQVAAGAMALNGVYIFLLDLLRWQHQPKFFALTSVLYTIVTISVALYSVLVLHSGIVGVFYGQVAGAVVGILVILGFSHDVYVFHFYLDKCKEMLRYSFPLVFSGIAVFINLNVDRIAINELMSVSDVGVYGVGFRIASVMTLLLMGVQAALFPLVLQGYKDASTPGQLAAILRYLFILVFGVVLILGLFSKEIIELVAAPEYYQASVVIPILALTFFFANPYNFAPGLMLVKKTKLVALIGVGAACLNVLLNILLIPLHGIVGAALATCLAALVGFITTVYYSQAYYPIPYNWKRMIIAAVVLFMALSFSRVVFEGGQLEYLLMYKFTLLIIFSVIIVFVLLKRSELLNLRHRCLRSKSS